MPGRQAGPVLGGVAAPANTPERAGAPALLAPLLPHFPWLRKRWADGGYTGEDFAAWVRTQRPKLDVEVIKRSDDVSGFKVLPKRWVVERTFGWLMQDRRLVRDYEETETSATDFIFLTLARNHYQPFFQSASKARNSFGTVAPKAPWRPLRQRGCYGPR